MKREKFALANIYVPVKRRATLNRETRRDGERFVLVHGPHRLEACKALGEDSIFGYLVQVQKH